MYKAETNTPELKIILDKKEPFRKLGGKLGGGGAGGGGGGVYSPRKMLIDKQKSANVRAASVLKNKYSGMQTSRRLRMALLKPAAAGATAEAASSPAAVSPDAALTPNPALTPDSVLKPITAVNKDTVSGEATETGAGERISVAASTGKETTSASERSATEEAVPSERSTDNHQADVSDENADEAPLDAPAAVTALAQMALELSEPSDDATAAAKRHDSMTVPDSQKTG